MRGNVSNPGALHLQLRRTTVTSEGNLRSYRVRPVSPTSYVSFYSESPVYLQFVCPRTNPAAVVACLAAAYSPPRNLSLGVCIQTPLATNRPSECCAVIETLANGSTAMDWCALGGTTRENGQEFYTVDGGTDPECNTVPMTVWTGVCAADGWDTTCTNESTSSERTIMCTVPYQFRTDEILEKLGYRLSINEMVEQTPSPKAVAKADRTVPLEITLVRPTALAVESQPITFDLKVTTDSAGINDAQASGGAPRPQGWLLPTACTATTQRPGAEKDRAQLKRTVDFKVNETSVTVNACLVVSEYSGEYTLEGKCDNLPDCIKTEARRPFNLKVGGLNDMTTNTPALNVVYIGETAFTPSSHWLTPANITTFGRIVDCWNAARRPRPNRPGQFLDPLLHVNDASLIWGGKFSINGSWSQTGHVAHRLGSSLDIRANNQAGAIPAAMRNAFQICVNSEPGVHWDFEQPPRVRPGQEHFHLDF